MRPLPPKKKLKKYQVILLAFVGVIVSLFIVARATNGLQFYSIPTTSNEPNIKPGDHVLTTNLAQPKRFDFICYRIVDSFEGRQIYLHRLCGLPGDRIEIRNDTLFVNGIDADRAMNLRKYFTVAAHDLSAVEVEPDDVSVTGNDSARVVLQTIKDSALIRKGRPFVDELFSVEYIIKNYQKKWTASNFGPYIVPKGKYFVLGDNRNSSRDSRYTGPVDISQYVGTVLGKK